MGHAAVIDRLKLADTADRPTPVAAPFIDRGIYLTPWVFRGRRQLVVIDHTHSVIHWEPVTDYGDRDAQVQSLRVLLMALDPVELRLMDN